MKTVFFFLLAIFFACTEAAECENGWTAYKDELCVKIFPTSFSNYEDAKSFCSNQGSENSPASLVMAKELAIQNLLAAYTNDTYDHVWLGAKYDKETSQFRWQDGEALTYSNWQEGSPRNITDSDICIELRPPNTRKSPSLGGKWADVTCRKRNVVMCQKSLSWSLQDAVNEIKGMRKQIAELENVASGIPGMQKQITELEIVASRVVPVGSIYIEYSNQPSPSTLWPDLTWQDISNTYAGLFFRTLGGGSGSWGATQAECAPRITQMQGTDTYTDYPFTIDIPSNGWSSYGYSGHHHNHNSREGMRFNTAGCEVRPKNQAIRIWKRIG